MALSALVSKHVVQNGGWNFSFAKAHLDSGGVIIPVNRWVRSSNRSWVDLCTAEELVVQRLAYLMLDFVLHSWILLEPKSWLTIDLDH
jgi:hypothetical protein